MISRSARASRLVDEGMTQSDAAREVGLHPGTVSKYRKDHKKSHAKMGRPPGIPSTCSACGERGHCATAGLCSTAAVARRLVEDGMSQAEAARVVGCSRQNVNNTLRRKK